MSTAAFLCVGSAVAQTNLVDSQLQNIDQSAVTSGIIYDRVTPLADLCVFNMPADKPHNTADFRFFKQALFELHKASNYKKLVSVEQLEQKLLGYKSEMNVVPIGIINTPFQILNYNPENASESGLILKDKLFTQVEGKDSFFNGYALVIAPLKNATQGEQIIYRFSNDLIFNNGDKIQSLTADFGGGQPRKIIENGVLIIKEVVIENKYNEGNKNINFTAESSNKFTFSTNGTIYTIQGNGYNVGLNEQPIECASAITGSLNLIGNFKTNYIEADEGFQGLNESASLKGQIEARVFYHTNNQNTTKTLLKPIIIVDGFDPSDGRKIEDCDCERVADCQEKNKNKITGIYDPDNHKSFVDLMNYYVDDSNTISTNLIQELRIRGYDVIIVNQPSYTTAGVNVDGGGDFIERNAMAFVQLVKEVNVKLQANGSNEKLVVMGPSMGGQITRYALAYMEKKFAQTGSPTWKHNTRIWVAFDSPNLGANVPLGDQALIKILGSDNVEAQKSFNKLQAVAASELLINSYKEYNTENQNTYFTDASTTSQGMTINKGNPLFQEHYNNQFGNGLPNSNGFPMNLRKLAIVNGSLSGETFGSGYEKILDVRLFKQNCLFNFNYFGWNLTGVCYTHKLFEAESYTTPITSNLVAHNKEFNASPTDFYASARGVRGILDNVPGGSIDATGELHKSIISASLFTDSDFTNYYLFAYGGLPEWETRTLKPNQCFIPTFSGIGMKNPNQNWANPLNRNLVCSNETYFDSYYGEAHNTAHVKLNYRSVNWLLKELGSSTVAPAPQAPVFPISPNALGYQGVVCSNKTSTFTFDPCLVPGVVINWSVDSTLATLSNLDDYSVTVRGMNNGTVTLTATFENGQTFSKTFEIFGEPSFRIRQTKRVAQTGYYLTLQSTGSPFSTQSVTWQTLPTGGCGYLQSTGSGGMTNYLLCDTSSQNCGANSCRRDIKVKVSNSCGSFEFVTTVGYGQNPDGRPANTNTNLYKIYPNPSNSIVSIDLRNQDLEPELSTPISGELFDMFGFSRANVKIIDNKANFSVVGLPKGIYILKINVDGKIESHQIAVE